jgi:hypothetical protein
MIKFIYERDDNDGHEFSGVDYIEMRIADEMNLEFMLVHYAEFLRALGYRVNGDLDVMENE